MTVRYSPEHLADDITTFIQSNVEAALARVRSERSDPRIKTNKPVKYYISETVDPRETPAVYVIIPEIDFQKETDKANFISAKSPLFISVVVEDINSEVLTRRIWRYTAAIAELVDQHDLTGTTGGYKLVVVVNKVRFSKQYTNAQAKGETSGVFRMEGVLECQIRHFENF
jgi:hypothetical protein